MALTGDRVEAKKAKEIGLINEVFKSEGIFFKQRRNDAEDKRASS